MNTVIAVPWRPQPGRIEAHDFVVNYYQSVMPDAVLIEVDTHHEPYNLAAVRNEGVREAEKLGADVVVLLDADCIISPHAHMLAAIDGAHADGKMHMPFKQQHYLTEEESRKLMDGVEFTPERKGLGNGACYAVRPSSYWQAGGSDERFSGWGGDDDQLVAACTTLIGLVRHDGHAMSLWHPAVRDVGSVRHQPNSRLARRYWRAMHRPAQMRAIIAERGLDGH